MTRAGNLFKRFENLGETSNRATARVNRAARYQPLETEYITEENSEDAGERVKGAGVAEGHQKAPTYAEHFGDTVRFAAMGQGGVPFVCTGPKLSTADGLKWVNERIKGFSDNPKARESFEAAVRRKHIAAHGEEFVNTLKREGGDSVKMELDMMMSPDAHSGIGDLDMLAKKSNVDNIRLDENGNITGKEFGVMSDELGKKYED